MKKLLLLLYLVPLMTAAQVTNVNLGNSPTDPGRDTFLQAWTKLNYNDNWLASQVARALTNSISLPTNLVASSFPVLLTNINPLNFSGSNYIGHFPQMFNVQLTTPILGGGGLQTPTNQFEQIAVSFNGSNWMNLTNITGVLGFGIQSPILQPVYVAVVGAPGNSGALSIYGLNQTNLYLHTNYLAGQVTQVAAPVNPNDIATKAYVDMHAGTVSPWLAFMDTNGANHCSYGFNSTTLADLVSSSAWVRIDGLAADGTGTNLILSIAQTNLVSGWRILSQTNLLAPLAAWSATTNYTATTNSGEVNFTLPINFNLTAQFYLAQASGTNFATFYEPVTAPALQLVPFTVTHSTNSTGGVAIGSLYADTNYLYEAVGTNHWSRLAWPTNAW